MLDICQKVCGSKLFFLLNRVFPNYNISRMFIIISLTNELLRKYFI